MYNWITLLYSRYYHNIVNQLDFNKTFKDDSGVPLRQNRLKIQCCHCSGTGLIPGQGSSTCCKCDKKKKKKEENADLSHFNTIWLDNLITLRFHVL